MGKKAEYKAYGCPADLAAKLEAIAKYQRQKTGQSVTWSQLAKTAIKEFIAKN